MKKKLQDYQHVYFIGIGGISMSGLAEILLNKGYHISGSDMHDTPVTRHLASLGIKVNLGHKEENLTNDIDLVVYTAAVKEDNPELMAAKNKKLAIMDRAHLLGSIMEDYEYSIAIAGTHGKTTTTSMASEILLYAEKDPTITVGGILPVIHSNTRVGNSPYFVAEACEYFDSFLQFHPKVGIILNVEADHLDYFKDLETIRHSFHDFGKKIPEDGLLIINEEIENVEELTADLSCCVARFGLGESSTAQWTARNIIHEDDGKNSFDLCRNGKVLEHIHLNVPGEHNISNAIAACIATYFLGVVPCDIAAGLEHFHGTDRRFQKKGFKYGVTVIDDYAHHPTEIRATLGAARKIKHKETWCVFQPHTFSRTRYLFDDFGDAFGQADHIIVADIYAAREKDTGLVTAQELAQRIADNGKDALYVGDFQQITDYLIEHCQPGDLLLTVGAGDVNKIGELFLS